jgi:hypothetical protein
MNSVIETSYTDEFSLSFMFVSAEHATDYEYLPHHTRIRLLTFDHCLGRTLHCRYTGPDLDTPNY